MKILFFIAAVAVGNLESDVERWNQGVDFYRAGDVTNALQTLKSLTSSREYGARASELVAKLEFERGDYEAATEYEHAALLEHPDDDRVNRNFTRVADGLIEKRENARIESVLKAAQGQDPGTLLRRATYDARDLFNQSGTYRTNAAEKAVALSDQLSKRAEKLADAWLPVREAIAQSVTNQEQAATIVAQLDQAREKTQKAANELSDFNGDAYGTLSQVEHDFTRFLKLAILPDGAIAEDILAQTNAWLDVEACNGRAWQQDALDYTRSFRAKFPAWAREYEQRAQSDTNLPPFTAEDQAKVSALATEVEKLQMECVEKNLPADQQRALNMLAQIQELLPKNNNGQGGQQGQQNQQSEQQPQNNQQQQDNQQNNDQQNNDQQNNESEQPEEPQEDEKSAEGQESEETPEDKEIEALLQKAQERNDEHEAEKKARMRKAPLPPNERDW